MGFRKYATFQGRATLSEFWFWILFCLIILWAVGIPIHKVGPVANFNAFFINAPSEFFYLSLILVLLVPTVAISTRRLHDTSMSGWWQVVVIVPALGWLAWFVLMVQPSGPNVFSRKRTSIMYLQTGLIFAAVGLITMVGIYVVDSFHTMDSRYRARSLSESKQFILVGVVTALIAGIWRRRHKSDDSLRS
jgi:uncharacterized membrane protein YhaH (DUF805 family)